MRGCYAPLGYVTWDVRNTTWFNSKNPLQRIFVGKKLGRSDFEFGMTQAFSGQMDGTSGTGMGLKPPKPGSFGFGDPLLKAKRVVAK